MPATTADEQFHAAERAMFDPDGDGRVNVTTPNAVRALGRFIADYWFWILCLVVLNGAAWAGAECLYPPGLRAQPGELWSVRMYLASGLLLLDNLFVLWWYADSTKQLVRKAEGQQQILEEQRDLMRDQLDQARTEYKESQRQLLVAQKPLVYTERVEDPDRPGHANYFVRNAGGGPAVNVYYIGLFDLVLGNLSRSAR